MAHLSDIYIGVRASVIMSFLGVAYVAGMSVVMGMLGFDPPASHFRARQLYRGDPMLSDGGSPV